MTVHALTRDKPALVLQVTPIGLTDLGAAFMQNKPYTGCRICGRVFQDALSRLDNPTPAQQVQAVTGRMEWSRKHARTHPQHVHDSLTASGRYMTPEAATKLASFGIIALSDMALDNESWNAGRESDRAPKLDCEGGN